MCGRIACALDVDTLSCITAYKFKQNQVYTKTKCHKNTEKFSPSYNVPPTSSVPVLVSAEHKCFQIESDDTKLETDRLLVSMRFGIVPHWIKPENLKSYNHETHLCKIERMRESKLYNPLYEKGYRCAVPCIGYYEWQSTKSTNKQPYFFYNKNSSVPNLEKGSFDLENGWKGMDILYLAGIFSVYKNSNGDDNYSFAIITKETSEEWQWVHHRMPIVLQSNDDVQNWIKYSVPTTSVFDISKITITNLSAHPVDKTIVNKTKNNNHSCIEPITLNKPTNKLMVSWLSSKTAKPIENEKLEKNIKKRSSLDSWLKSANKKPKSE